MKRKINWYRVGDIITFILPWILAIGLMVGCSSVKYVPIQGETIVEYKDTTIFIRDTIEIEVPKEIVKEIVPQDTVSVLKTSVALSEAKIYNGSLHHKLEQKGTVKTQIDTVIKVQYVDKYIYEEVPVEVEVIKYKRDTIFWISIIFNVMVLMIVAFKIYLKLKK